MKFILILGMPRSGTSIFSEIIEKIGFDFGLNNQNSLDTFYQNSTNKSFYQDKTIHLYLMNAGVTNFQPHSKPIDTSVFLNHRVIKEPYMVGILNQVRHLIDKVVLVIRNPNDVIDSDNNFFADNGHPEIKFNIQVWKQYYITFLNLIGDLPYKVFNYDILLKSPEKVIDSLFSFLSVDKTDITVTIKEKSQASLLNLDMGSMTLYKSLTENMSSKMIIKLMEKSKESTCFCDSKRKYKKCCRNYVAS
jgi:hypothetical protein